MAHTLINFNLQACQSPTTVVVSSAASRATQCAINTDKDATPLTGGGEGGLTPSCPAAEDDSEEDRRTHPIHLPAVSDAFGLPLQPSSPNSRRHSAPSTVLMDGLISLRRADEDKDDAPSSHPPDTIDIYGPETRTCYKCRRSAISHWGAPDADEGAATPQQVCTPTPTRRGAKTTISASTPPTRKAHIVQLVLCHDHSRFIEQQEGTVVPTDAPLDTCGPCAMGKQCRFVHVDIPLSKLKGDVIHVHYVYRDEALCGYERLSTAMAKEFGCCGNENDASRRPKLEGEDVVAEASSASFASDRAAPSLSTPKVSAVDTVTIHQTYIDVAPAEGHCLEGYTHSMTPNTRLPSTQILMTEGARIAFLAAVNKKNVKPATHTDGTPLDMEANDVCISRHRSPPPSLSSYSRSASPINTPASFSSSVPPAPKVVRHCAHYYYSQTCTRGASCHFIHVVSVDPTQTRDSTRPASFRKRLQLLGLPTPQVNTPISTPVENALQVGVGGGAGSRPRSKSNVFGAHCGPFQSLDANEVTVRTPSCRPVFGKQSNADGYSGGHQKSLRVVVATRSGTPLLGHPISPTFSVMRGNGLKGWSPEPRSIHVSSTAQFKQTFSSLPACESPVATSHRCEGLFECECYTGAVPPPPLALRRPCQAHANCSVANQSESTKDDRPCSRLPMSRQASCISLGPTTSASATTSLSHPYSRQGTRCSFSCSPAVGDEFSHNACEVVPDSRSFHPHISPKPSTALVGSSEANNGLLVQRTPLFAAQPCGVRSGHFVHNPYAGAVLVMSLLPEGDVEMDAA